MNDRACIIWTEDGCWFQQRVDGVLRSSWLGKIGSPDEVRERCKDMAVDFSHSEFCNFSGMAIRERWPKDCAPVDGSNGEGG